MFADKNLAFSNICVEKWKGLILKLKFLNLIRLQSRIELFKSPSIRLKYFKIIILPEISQYLDGCLQIKILVYIRQATSFFNMVDNPNLSRTSRRINYSFFAKRLKSYKVFPLPHFVVNEATIFSMGIVQDIRWMRTDRDPSDSRGSL